MHRESNEVFVRGLAHIYGANLPVQENAIVKSDVRSDWTTFEYSLSTVDED